MKFIERLKRPISEQELDRMPICDIMRLRRRICANGTLIVPDGDDDTRKATLRKLVADRIYGLLSSGYDGKISVYNVHDSDYNEIIGCSDMEFNSTVKEFALAHKLYRSRSCDWDPSDWDLSDWDPNLFVTVSAASYGVNPRLSEDSIEDTCDKVIVIFADEKSNFERLKDLVQKYEWAIPVVKRINVRLDTADDEWKVDWLKITPEMLDGFMEAARNHLDAEEAEAYRNDIIKRFRNEIRETKCHADFDYPIVAVMPPDAWKVTYHEKIKPTMERRARCKDTVDEINRGINPLELMPYRDTYADIPFGHPFFKRPNFGTLD